MMCSMSSAPPATATILTPRGRGAVASVAVEGPAAVGIVDRLFTAASRKRLPELPLGRIAFGRWTAADDQSADGQPGEELVVCRVGDEQIEVHCHGGQAAVQAIVESLLQCGVVLQSAEEYGARHEPSRLAAEARGALGKAVSERTALILLDQYHGALSREVEDIAAALRGGDRESARRRLARLLALAELGMHLVRPWRIVLAGPPNVGKSSLMNALVGYERSIVFDQPGTTRDVLTASAVLDGWPVEFADTAGLRDSNDALERTGVSLSREQVEHADLVLLVRDAADRTTANLETPPDHHRRIVVWNKIDLCRPEKRPNDGLRVSALTGEGIEGLLNAIVSALVPVPPEPGEAMLFTERQVGIVRQAIAVLETGNAQTAATVLAEL
jgi:tRNA modification GTPase